MLAKYPGFFQSLLDSPSQEVVVLANVVARDPNSNTADNLVYIKELTELSPWTASIKFALPSQVGHEK